MSEPQDGVQPWFITKPRAVSAVVGQHVLLSCAVAGDPFPKYTWTRGDLSRPLTSGVDYELLQKEDVISLLIRSNTHMCRQLWLPETLDQKLNPASPSLLLLRQESEEASHRRLPDHPEVSQLSLCVFVVVVNTNSQKQKEADVLQSNPLWCTVCRWTEDYTQKEETPPLPHP